MTLLGYLAIPTFCSNHGQTPIRTKMGHLTECIMGPLPAFDDPFLSKMYKIES